MVTSVRKGPGDTRLYTVMDIDLGQDFLEGFLCGEASAWRRVFT